MASHYIHAPRPLPGMVLLLALFLAVASCGYQIAGRADTLPDTIGLIEY